MSADDVTLTTDDAESSRRLAAPVPALVMAWSSSEPRRVGEVAFVVDEAPRVLGRGGDGDGRLEFGRQRPGELLPGGPLTGRGISRRQLEVRRDGEELHIRRLGRCPLLHRGAEVDEVRLQPGEAIRLRGQLVLLSVLRRPTMASAWNLPPERWPTFGAPDGDGMIGEAPAMWRLRDDLALVAQTPGHILVCGPSGAGKELIAGAVHRQSSRSEHPFVARNAATLPESLIDAELFGHSADYPQPGMKGRGGLIGDADRGTLFLDEIGELPHALQAHLLRVLDEGEYQRLGEATRRRADLRLVAATNRQPDALKGDFAARFKVRLVAPSLNERREDVPLLLAHLLIAALDETPALRARFELSGRGAELLAGVSPELIEALVQHAYSFHVRELDRLLWRALLTSRGPRVELTAEVRAELEAKQEPTDAPQAPSASSTSSADQISAEDVATALRAHGGNKVRAAESLGISRYQLYRLLKR